MDSERTTPPRCRTGRKIRESQAVTHIGERRDVSHRILPLAELNLRLRLRLSMAPRVEGLKRFEAPLFQLPNVSKIVRYYQCTTSRVEPKIETPSVNGIESTH